MDIFSDENRRDPYPLYAQLRSRAPIFKVPQPFNAWMIFDYDDVYRALKDHEGFSSRVPAPSHWFIFTDAPEHTKLRALISKAFTPRTIANIEPFIREVSRSLLDQVLDAGHMDLANDFAVPLAMKVIAHMIGIPGADWPKFKTWSDSILKISYARGADDEAQRVIKEFADVSAEMNEYLGAMISERRRSPTDDLLSKLIAEIDGQRLDQAEILGFFQLLVVGGQETTANLINNAILCFLENPKQLALLRGNMRLLPSALEEVLRYRSPVQWVMRTPTQTIRIKNEILLPGQLVLAVIGSANRDPNHFERPEEFDITRDPNPHIAFGRGSHFCLGSALARLEGKIALHDLVRSFTELERISNHPWEPRKALNIHGPTRLRVRFRPARVGPEKGPSFKSPALPRRQTDETFS